MIKVIDFEYFIFIAFKLKFGVKSLLSEGGDTGGGIYVSPCSVALVLCVWGGCYLVTRSA